MEYTLQQDEIAQSIKNKRDSQEKAQETHDKRQIVSMGLLLTKTFAQRNYTDQEKKLVDNEMAPLFTFIEKGAFDNTVTGLFKFDTKQTNVSETDKPAILSE